MPRPRPTLRCLFDDIAERADAITDGNHRVLLSQRKAPHISVPLDEVAHPLVRTTARDFEGETLPRSAVQFQSVKDNPWHEAKHGERWRGLVRWHPTEQCWLCFAGWHERGSLDDIYERFTAACTVVGGVDSSSFLPEKRDHIRLAAELKWGERQRSKHEFRVAVIRVLLDAVSDVGTPQTTSLPDGTAFRVSINTDADDMFDEICLRFTINWSGGRGHDQVNDVKDAIPGVAPSEWKDLPPVGGVDPSFAAYVEDDWIGRLVNAAEQHGIDALGTDPNLALDPSDGLAHVGPSDAVTAAYVEGLPLRSLCGRRFVPAADPQAADDCPHCMFIVGIVEAARTSGQPE